MAPGWRHDDPMNLKKLIRLEIIGPDDWQKFQRKLTLSISSKRVHKKVYGRNKNKNNKNRKKIRHEDE